MMLIDHHLLCLVRQLAQGSILVEAEVIVRNKDDQSQAVSNMMSLQSVPKDSVLFTLVDERGNVIEFVTKERIVARYYEQVSCVLPYFVSLITCIFIFHWLLCGYMTSSCYACEVIRLRLTR